MEKIRGIYNKLRTKVRTWLSNQEKPMDEQEREDLVSYTEKLVNHFHPELWPEVLSELEKGNRVATVSLERIEIEDRQNNRWFIEKQKPKN